VIEIPNKRYFRPDEVARILEQPLRTVYYWLAHDKIKHLHYGRKTLISNEEMERILRLGISNGNR
jgi:excisionase family DNA binding protein